MEENLSTTQFAYRESGNCTSALLVTKHFINKHLDNPPGTGDSAYERGGDARQKFWIKPLKETDLGVAQAFLTPKRDQKIYISNIYFYIFSRATLNETFKAKYYRVLPRTP